MSLANKSELLLIRRREKLIEKVDALIEDFDHSTRDDDKQEILKLLKATKTRAENEIKELNKDHYMKIINNLRPNATIKKISDKPFIAIIK